MAKQSSNKASGKSQKFRLRAGSYQQKEINSETGERNALKTYQPGDVVSSASDLVAKYGPEKFERLSGKPVLASEPELGEKPLPNQPQDTEYSEPADGDDERGNPNAHPGLNDPEPDDDDEGDTADEQTSEEYRHELEHKTVANLKELAEEQEVALGSAKLKDDIINLLVEKYAGE